MINKFHRIVVLDFLLVIVFFPLLILCIFLFVQVTIIWVKGERIEAKITSIEKIENDRYNLNYTPINSNHQIKFAREISLQTYNHIKDHDKLNLIYWSADPDKSIILDLDDRNDIIKLGLAIIVFSFFSFAGLKSLWRQLYAPSASPVRGR